MPHWLSVSSLRKYPPRSMLVDRRLVSAWTASIPFSWKEHPTPPSLSIHIVRRAAMPLILYYRAKYMTWSFSNQVAVIRWGLGLYDPGQANLRNLAIFPGTVGNELNFPWGLISGTDLYQLENEASTEEHRIKRWWPISNGIIGTPWSSHVWRQTP